MDAAALNMKKTVELDFKIHPADARTSDNPKITVFNAFSSAAAGLFMTFYAGCFISASFATGAIGKSIRQVAIPILIYRSQQERKNGQRCFVQRQQHYSSRAVEINSTSVKMHKSW